MELPKNIKIAGFDITIIEWKPLEASAVKRFGEFSALEQCIRIDSSMATNMKLIDTLVHEITHAIFWAYAIYDEDKEERIAAIMGTAWTQIYRDNPELIDFIKYKLN